MNARELSGHRKWISYWFQGRKAETEKSMKKASIGIDKKKKKARLVFNSFYLDLLLPPLHIDKKKSSFALSSSSSSRSAALADTSSMRLVPLLSSSPLSSFAARGGSGGSSSSRRGSALVGGSSSTSSGSNNAAATDAEVWRARREQLEEQRRKKAAAANLSSSSSSNNVVAAPPHQAPRGSVASPSSSSSSSPPSAPLPSTNFFSFQQEGFSAAAAAPSGGTSGVISSSNSELSSSFAPGAGRSFSAEAASATAEAARASEAAEALSSSPSFSSSLALSSSSSSADPDVPLKKAKGRPKADAAASEAPAPAAFDVESGVETAAPKKKKAAATTTRKKATTTKTTTKRVSKKAAAAAAAESNPLTAADSPLRALLSRPPPTPLPAEGPPPPPDVLVVESLPEARRVAEFLLSVARRGQHVWACDTEVAEIDITKESPCGHGKVICFTVYGGEDVDFAAAAAVGSSSSSSSSSSAAVATAATQKGPAALKKSSLFVDTLVTRGADSLRSAEDEAEDAAAEAARAVYSASAPLAADSADSAAAAAEAVVGESGSISGVEVSSSSASSSSAATLFDPSDFPESVNAAALAAADHARASALAARQLRDAAAAREAEQVLALFAPFFEDASIPKIWHNYSFDRHVLGNHGIDAKGFGGDTMHMARLLDSARGRVKGKGYSLESLSNDRAIMGPLWEKAQDNLHAESSSASSALDESSAGSKKAPSPSPKKKGGSSSPADAAAVAAAAAASTPSGDDSVTRSKTSMKALFGARKLKKDGTPGKVVVLPPVEELQGSPASRGKWIRYASLDARCTYWLGRALEGRLRAVPCSPDAAIRDATGFGAPIADPSNSGGAPPRQFTMWDLYRNTWLPFGEILTDMEAEGVLVDREHLAGAELAATADRAAAVARFRAWASARVPGAAFMNVCSGPQIRQLLFSGALRQDLFEKGSWDPEVREVVRAAVAAEEAAVRAEEEAERENAAAAAALGEGSLPEIPPGIVFASASSSSSAAYPDLPEGLTPVDAHLSPDDDDAFASDDESSKKGKEKPKLLELSRVFKAPNEAGLVEPNISGSGKAPKKPKKTIDIRLHGLWGRAVPSPLQPPAFTPSGWPAVSTPVLRGLSGEPGAALRALAELDGGDGAAAALPPPVAEGADEAAARALLGSVGEEDDEFGGGSGGGNGDALFATVDEDGAPPAPKTTQPPAPSRDNDTKNAPAPKGVGTLYSAFGGGREGLEASAAVDSLCELAAIDTLLSAFIVPLQGPTAATRVDRRDPTSPLGRIHCSLNINTETGRLSARRPNLQNQPALEKDRYGVRRAFRASEGKTLIVADYGQLELRLLAHMAGCESMIRAFEAGGDFHSRTALGMYDYIRGEVDAGLCALEAGEEGKTNDVPLIKDRYASERRRAKVLNFSIAYGKTAHGLSRDWGVSLEEAQETVDRWYADRPEVREWQVAMRHEAVASGRVRTLLGRTRSLPEAASRVPSLRSHALRAAINTPIQGSAADVATAAMLSIARDRWLRERGWKLLLQVHDEVILEGPKESADEATARVVSLMERPFWGTNPLRVELAVDAKHAENWYEAK